MGSKEHKPFRWRQIFNKETIVVIICITVVLFQVWKQWKPSDVDESNTASILNKNEQNNLDIKQEDIIRQEDIATNNCNWHPLPLLGYCDVTKTTEESGKYNNAIDCENACCESDSCISFQFRSKEGCQFGGDTRLGAEKDGVPAWCEPRAPAVWKGQWIKLEGADIIGACNDQGWNPQELPGQCFGLGSSQNTENNTPESCRDGCCNKDDCSVWQWREDAGCFYNKNAHGCKDANPEDFKPFIGKRKITEGRTYTPYAYSKDFADMAIQQ